MFFFKKHTIYFLAFTGLLMVGCSDDIALISSKIPVVKEVKTLGGSKNDAARSVISTSDGGYAITGFSQSIDGDITDKLVEQYDFWLLKFDANDQLQWNKTFGGSKDDRAQKVIQTDDGGFALIGYSRSEDEDVSENEGFQDVWILKLDSSGDISWERNIGFTGNDQGFSIIQTTDGGYFIGGILDVTASGGLGNKPSIQKKHAGGDYWGLKLDANGTTEWRNYFGGTNTDTCYDVVETQDGYVLVGSSDSADVDINGNKGSYDFWLVKIDLTGNILWEKSLGGQEIEAAYAVTQSPDGNLILVGDTRSSDQDVSVQHGGADLWVVKIDTNGNLIWEKSFGGTSFDVARSIINTVDGSYVIVGSSRSADMDVKENKGQNDVWAIKINDSGELIWETSIGGSEIDFAYGVTQLQNGSFIIVGDTSSNDQDITENKGFTDNLIIKIDEE